MSRPLCHDDSTLFQTGNHAGNLVAAGTLSVLGKFDGGSGPHRAASNHEVCHDFSRLQRAKRVRRCLTARKIAIVVQGTAYARRGALLGTARGAYWPDATPDRRRRRDANGPPRNRGCPASVIAGGHGWVAERLPPPI